MSRDVSKRRASRPVRRSAAAALAFACVGLAATAQAQPPPVTPDDFVAAVSGSDQYEIMAGRLAQVESHDPAVRAFATEMVRDHAAAHGALRDAATRSGLKPPSSSVGGDQAQLLSALQGLRGVEFDRAYGRQQRLAHQQAAVTVRGYIRDGSDANLKTVAQADLQMITRHLGAARELPQ